MTIKTFKEIVAWQKSHELVLMVYVLTARYPKYELFGLTSQSRRCAVSIPSNIAEGFNRYHTKEFKQFLYISLGSCAELETQVEISQELGYLERLRKDDLLEKLNHESRMLRSLLNKL